MCLGDDGVAGVSRGLEGVSIVRNQDAVGLPLSFPLHPRGDKEAVREAEIWIDERLVVEEGKCNQ